MSTSYPYELHVCGAEPEPEDFIIIDNSGASALFSRGLKWEDVEPKLREWWERVNLSYSVADELSDRLRSS